MVERCIEMRPVSHVLHLAIIHFIPYTLGHRYLPDTTRKLSPAFIIDEERMGRSARICPAFIIDEERVRSRSSIIDLIFFYLCFKSQYNSYYGEKYQLQAYNCFLVILGDSEVKPIIGVPCAGITLSTGVPSEIKNHLLSNK